MDRPHLATTDVNWGYGERHVKEILESDVVIVGAGSAGCVLASRLSENPSLRVLVLEAGRRDRFGVTRLPSALMRVAGNSRYDWLYTSEPDPTRNGRTEAWPRGKTLGGSSAINGAIFVRGAPSDYDGWAAMGCAGWAWRDVLPLFRRLETADVPDNADRGGLGPQRVSSVRWVHPLTPKFIAAAVAAGIPFTEDLNGPRREGVGYNQGSTIRGRRLGAYEAFVEPHLRSRPNLTVLDDVLVQHVRFDGCRAVGVRVRRGGRQLEISARGGVVLAAGAINSPQILMLSGVGSAEELRRHGIAPLADSREVGQNLMEHPGLHVQVEVDQRTGNRESEFWRAAWNVGRWLICRDGPVSSPTAQALAFLRSDTEAPACDLQFHLLPYGATLQDGGHRVTPRRNLLTIQVNINHPRSRGWVELRSADPAAAVMIHPRLLEEQVDVECLLRGLHWLRLVAATPPFGPHVRALLDAPPASAGREADIAYLRAATIPFLHPVGTCRMGSDAGSVTTPELRVRGADGLWVADASIFPCHTAGNINATALMIGEKAAELVGAALSVRGTVTPKRAPASVDREGST